MKKLLLSFLMVFGTAAYAANTATISFAAPTARTDGAPVQGALSYKVYQGIGPGATKTLVGTITTTTSTISVGLFGGNNYCWEVTVTEAAPGLNQESARSNEACKTFPTAGVNPVTITVQ
jgi:hypothetical protein